MSGGAYNYLFRYMEEVAHKLKIDPLPYRRAFGDHMLKCAEAMHRIEWVDSGDESPGDDFESIMKCIDHVDILQTVVRDAESMRKDLEGLISIVLRGEK